MTVKKAQLHVSGLKDLQKCGQKFAFRNIDGIKTPTGLAALRGNVCHRTSELDLQHKIDHGTLLPDEAIPDLVSQSAHEFVEKRGMFLGPNDPQTIKEAMKFLIDEAMGFALIHHEKLAPIINPIAVEEKWIVEIAGFPFDIAGTFDVTQLKGFRDAKNRAKSPNANEAFVSTQVSAYALGYYVTHGEVAENIAIDVIVKTKTMAKVVTQETSRDMSDIKTILGSFEAAAKVIESGAYMHADPEVAWWCSAQWCGYHSICPWVRRPVSVATGGINV